MHDRRRVHSTLFWNSVKRRRVAGRFPEKTRRPGKRELRMIADQKRPMAGLGRHVLFYEVGREGGCELARDDRACAGLQALRQMLLILDKNQIVRRRR